MSRRLPPVVGLLPVLCLLLGGAGAALADEGAPPTLPQPSPLPPPPSAGPAPLPPPCEAPRDAFEATRHPSLDEPILTSGACRPPCAQRRDACCWPLDARGCRYGRTEILVEGTFGCLPSPEGLLGEPTYGAGAQLAWDDVDYPGTLGGRLTVRHALAPQSWVELRGTYYGRREATVQAFGVFGFAPGSAVPGPGLPALGVSEAVAATLASEAETWGAEVNYVSELSCSGCFRWDLLVGGRYHQLNEVSSAHFATPPLPGFQGPAFVNSDAENLFAGLQVGAVVHWDLRPDLELNGLLKGIGGNVRRTVTVTDRSIFVGGPHASASEDDEIVFGAEIELGFRWRFAPRWALTGGYNLFFLDNVLRAYDAMDFTHSQSGAVQAVQATDQLLQHTFFLGFGVNF